MARSSENAGGSQRRGTAAPEDTWEDAQSDHPLCMLTTSASARSPRHSNSRVLVFGSARDTFGQKNTSERSQVAREGARGEEGGNAEKLCDKGTESQEKERAVVSTQPCALSEEMTESSDIYLVPVVVEHAHSSPAEVYLALPAIEEEEDALAEAMSEAASPRQRLHHLVHLNPTLSTETEWSDAYLVRADTEWSEAYLVEGWKSADRGGGLERGVDCGCQHVTKCCQPPPQRQSMSDELRHHRRGSLTMSEGARSAAGSTGSLDSMTHECMFGTGPNAQMLRCSAGLALCASSCDDNCMNLMM